MWVAICLYHCTKPQYPCLGMTIYHYLLGLTLKETIGIFLIKIAQY